MEVGMETVSQGDRCHSDSLASWVGLVVAVATEYRD
jgi:hypothetical protein